MKNKYTGEKFVYACTVWLEDYKCPEFIGLANSIDMLELIIRKKLLKNYGELTFGYGSNQYKKEVWPFEFKVKDRIKIFYVSLDSFGDALSTKEFEYEYNASSVFKNDEKALNEMANNIQNEIDAHSFSMDINEVNALIRRLQNLHKR